MKKDKTLHYDGLELPESLPHILDQDFWLLDNITKLALIMMESPMKFTSTTAIFVRKGNGRAEINLQKFDIVAPCIVVIQSDQIMQPLEMSEDFEAAFIVMSDKLVDELANHIEEKELLLRFKEKPMFRISNQYVQDFNTLFMVLKQVMNDNANPYKFKIVVHTIVAFFYNLAIRCMEEDPEDMTSQAYLTSQFLKLAQQHFKKERFLEFYANQLQITTKHLSRTVKAETGFTAGDWLDRLVLLEAKVLLKSSNMNIQQIAEELNFPSQSFFGKYFKHNVGLTPKQFRNS